MVVVVVVTLQKENDAELDVVDDNDDNDEGNLRCCVYGRLKDENWSVIAAHRRQFQVVSCALDLVSGV